MIDRTPIPQPDGSESRGGQPDDAEPDRAGGAGSSGDAGSASSIDASRAGWQRDGAAEAWWLALLLTGDRAAAEMILLRVLVRDRVPPAKVAQGLVMASRTVERERVPISAWAALLRLANQPREAWVLRRVQGLGPIDTARAMDCSRSASERFLEQGEAELDRLSGEGLKLGSLAAELRRWSRGEPMPASLGSMVRARLLRARLKRVGMWLGGVVLALGAVWGIVALVT